MLESNVTRVLRKILDEADHPLRVIEIGTAYGDHLHHLQGCGNLKELVSIDPMYDWVPDLRPEDKFDRGMVSTAKVDSWWKNSEGLQAWLLICKSCDGPSSGRLVGTFDVLVIDGCHHPAAAVEADYWDYVHLLSPDHTVIFDDINHGDPGIAANAIEAKLQNVSREEFEGGKIRVLRVSPPRPIQSPEPQS